MLLNELFLAMTAPKTSMKPAKRIARKKATAKRKAANAAKKRKVSPKKRVNIKHHVPKIASPKINSLAKKAKKSLTRE